MLRGREEENVAETLVTCGKTAGKVATSAVAAAGAAQIKIGYVLIGPDGKNADEIHALC